MMKDRLHTFLKVTLIICCSLFALHVGVAFAETPGVMEGCTPLPSILSEIKSCILCPLFKVILETDQTMATKSFDALAPSFRNLIVIVLALIIAYKTLIAVTALTKQELGKYLGELAVQAFKVLVAVLLLHNSYYIYHYVINPLMKSGLEFGLTIIKGNILEDLKAEAASSGGLSDGVISKDLLAQVLGTIKMFSQSAAELPAIGRALMCVSRHSAAVHHFMDISMFIEGLICFAFGWLILLACCFYLLDSIVRFGIFCTLLPFLIASWPFKITFQYTRAGWGIFINVFFNFVMMGLVLSLSSELIAQALTGGSGGKEEIIAALNGNEVSTIKELMDLDGAKFLVLMACCIFAIKIVQRINELADKISDTKGGKGIGNQIGGLAANVATRAGKAAVGGVAAITGAKGIAGGIKDRLAQRDDAIRSRIGAGSRSNPNGYRGGNSGNNSGGGSNAGGGSDTGGSSETPPPSGFSEDTSSYD